MQFLNEAWFQQKACHALHSSNKPVPSGWIHFENSVPSSAFTSISLGRTSVLIDGRTPSCCERRHFVYLGIDACGSVLNSYLEKAVLHSFCCLSLFLITNSGVWKKIVADGYPSVIPVSRYCRLCIWFGAGKSMSRIPISTKLSSLWRKPSRYIVLVVR